MSGDRASATPESGAGASRRTPMGRGPGGRFGPGGPGPRRPRFRVVRKLAGAMLAVLLLAVGTASLIVWRKYEQLVSDLPTVGVLRTYQPPVMSRIYSGDGRVIAELAAERRLFVPYNAIPDKVKAAFVSAEDQNFYTHGGVDPLAILRAAVTDLETFHKRRPIGASTITQQVARIMLLGSNARTFERKAKEAVLAMRIEQTLSKDRILEIYLNEIYLGAGAYGITAASQTYFNKPLDQLDAAEAAFLGALPKSPTNYNPYRNPEAAKTRRDWVLDRMADTHAITVAEAQAAKAEPLVPKAFVRPGPVPGSEWFSEEVRRQLLDRYGENQTMQGGLVVHTSLDPALQDEATQDLRDGLMHYDRAHGGWRGAVTHLDGIGPVVVHHARRGHAPDAPALSWEASLAAVARPAGMVPDWRMAVVLSPALGSVGWLDNPDAAGGPGSPHQATLDSDDMAWMRTYKGLRAGDVLMVEPHKGTDGQPTDKVAIRQIPQVEGAIVSMDPTTGRVLALVGGWSFESSQFNRATQALRQPGSSFKPIVYLAGMMQGISPSQKFEDEPYSNGTWHPNNYEKTFGGPTTLHDALRRSLNLVTIRLAAHIGMSNVAKLAIDLHEVDAMPKVLPAALGAVETTVLRESGAYASIASGGKEVLPSLIDDVQDRDGHVIWRPAGLGVQASADPSQPPVLTDTRRQVADPASAFQVVQMMQAVLKPGGTGRKAGAGIDFPIAGKTGTSQDFRDAWFAGFAPNLLTIVWVGFDNPQSLGEKEDGDTVAGPIWNRFMKAAMANRPHVQFRVPDGVAVVQVGDAIDAYKPGQIPGISNNLFVAKATPAELGAMDTGAENVPDAESDMGSAPAPGADIASAGGVSVDGQSVDSRAGTLGSPANPAQPGLNPPGQPGALAAGNAPAKPGAADIGMGGLY
ncbi:penicillin-binding protein 1A [Lichenicola sp.]|uniref:penicillin-binding protein 1A n=1 Tax=Lichenicola sp. TaxID=2804529 RepID=UPI003AFFCD8F